MCFRRESFGSHIVTRIIILLFPFIGSVGSVFYVSCFAFIGSRCQKQCKLET